MVYYVFKGKLPSSEEIIRRSFKYLYTKTTSLPPLNKHSEEYKILMRFLNRNKG